MTDRPWREAIAAGSIPLGVLAVLFLLTATFGRSFSKLELGFSWLHPTELLIAAATLIALVQVPFAEWFARLKATGALIPLILLWVLGAIAAVRGLTDWGFSLVLHDIGLVEYSVLVPVMALVIRTPAQFNFFCLVVALGGVAAMITYAATLWTPLQWDLAQTLNLISPATGLYLGVFVTWIAARQAAGEQPSPWWYALAVLAVTMIILGAARSAWLGLAAGLLVVVALAIPGRRLLMIGGVTAVVGLGLALSIPAEDLDFGTAPTSTEAQGGAGGDPGALREVTASFRQSSQGENSSWRLDFWTFMVEESAERPLLGAGFGRPSEFRWEGVVYDRRQGDPGDPFDVTGPHNSFVHMLYRTGVGGLIAIVALVALAGLRLFRLARDRDLAEQQRGLAIWLLAALAVAIGVASFSVALEGPFMGIYFWGLLGLGLLAPAMLRGAPDPPGPSPMTGAQPTAHRA